MDAAEMTPPEPLERYCEGFGCNIKIHGSSRKRFCSDRCRTIDWKLQRYTKARKLIEEALILLGPKMSR